MFYFSACWSFRRPVINIVFITESEEISDPQKIADYFCKYFSNIGPTLASKIPSYGQSHWHFLPESEEIGPTLASKIPSSGQSHRRFLPEKLINSMFF